jgi:hypothetical protein
VQAPGRPGTDSTAAAVKAEPPPGPSHPPMDEPVRRPAGPVLSMASAVENGRVMLCSLPPLLTIPCGLTLSLDLAASWQHRSIPCGCC